NFSIRNASSELEDGKRILAFCDSQLEWLAQVGSSAQWGLEPYSTNDDTQEKYRAFVERSEQDQSWSKEWKKSYIAELDITEDQITKEIQPYLVHQPRTNSKSSLRLPVAAMLLTGHSEHYAQSILPEQDDQDPFIWIRYLLSDRRLGTLSKGAGLALIEHAKSVAQQMGIRRLCLDCWSGNDRKLVRYYERHGFVSLGDVSHNDWPSAVLELRLD
ncbi:hypothetical protein HII31_07721, partial [Pseudocercospora fuligena]